ncbi:ribonucleotide-diphosphate reductase subunit alpha [Alteromonas phage vB_AmaP_AD45-P2]|uniref:Ribonucleotide-diphosphate reductase subunit alpha n=2 Tax=Pseudomonadota TaxID=1224 RepID=A0A922P0G7_9HYPH|nr:ribonucleoside-diphosphate reductase subunit alpha [Pseudorhizobium pelagicum]YP_008126084.1 ribonucleotide reductase [Alteromonas phage vB_AmaP_AD45-P1]AGM47048.1 ribonucleotide-diphosphate reductase subunit alpha [Alteromonas phage vB_AmaP_AD45-P3]AGM47164.1 ribonucleotide-diphosphate reductase subunit alpha [Alteromonas phage vB_AmaP_AD45-P4]AGM47286.1 ribonucleotide-diphosphate reductase subunit alpha [Alteromonas phage vB_AmaP_AD45-P2]AGM46931.1 ribonucleotide-diphosphate reductase sub
MLDFAKELLKKHYCRPNETIAEAFKRASDCFSSDPEHSHRLQDYLQKEWFMYSSPILSNAPAKGETSKGMPISCFLTYVPDSIDGLCEHTSEERWLSVKGGGVGGHWSDVRAISDKTPGVNGFLHTVDADMLAYRQGKTRRGSYAAYLDVSHPEIVEFVKMRTPTGDLNRKNLNLHHGVNITDDFIDAVNNNLNWQLKDTHNGKVVENLPARQLWEEILTTRFRTGEPYLNFVDEANRRMHPALQHLKIHGSNLCNEIHLPTDENRTAVCCLSSVNLGKYDEWKDDKLFIGDLIEMLDNVLEYFIENAPAPLARAKYSAMRERSLGLGAMGFHDYLMQKNVPFESSIAISINKSMFKNIKSNAVAKTRELAVTRGPAPDAEEYGVRNTHLLAIAPNANSSIILGVSASIEPRASNCYTHKTRVGSHLVKNPALEKVLDQHGQNNEDVWKSIMQNDGSVKHLTFLTKDEKEVFKTAPELDQHWVVEMSRARQGEICQGQSVNLHFPAGANKAYVNAVHRRAFKPADDVGVPLKGLYYLRTEASAKTENVSVQVKRDALKDGVQGSLDTCLACEG